jgi:hypothetical protein
MLFNILKSTLTETGRGIGILLFAEIAKISIYQTTSVYYPSENDLKNNYSSPSIK